MVVMVLEAMCGDDGTGCVDDDNLYQRLTKFSQNSSVGIATRYRLDSPGIESRWSENLCTRLDRLWGPPSLLYNGYRVLFSVAKRPGVALTTQLI